MWPHTDGLFAFEGTSPSTLPVGSYLPPFSSYEGDCFRTWMILALCFPCVVLACIDSHRLGRPSLRPTSFLECSFTVRSSPWFSECSLLSLVTGTMSPTKKGRDLPFCGLISFSSFLSIFFSFFLFSS